MLLRLLVVAAAVWPALSSATPPADPVQPHAEVPSVVYHSAFAAYQSLPETMLALALAFPFVAHANTEPVPAAADVAVGGAGQASMTEGEIKRINKETGKLTIKHGPIVNLGMPAMTMVFRTADAAMLDEVKVGDPIRFIVEKLTENIPSLASSARNRFEVLRERPSRITSRFSAIAVACLGGQLRIKR